MKRLLPILIFLILVPNVNAWWNTSWNERYQINFHENIESKRNATMINSSAPTGNCTATGGVCDDLRLICNYTGVDVEYDRVNKSAYDNTSNSTTPMDFMINKTGEMILADINNTCWWYVNNTGAGSPPDNGSEVYLFYEDGTNRVENAWSLGGGWSFTNGYLQGLTDGQTATSSLQNYGDDGVYRFRWYTTGIAGSSTRINIIDDNGGNYIRITDLSDDVTVYDKGASIITDNDQLSATTWFNMRINKVGTNYSYYLNDIFRGSGTGTEYTSTQIKFEMAGGTDKRFDDIIVHRGLSVTTSLGDEETLTAPNAEMITANNTNYTTSSQTLQARAWDINIGDTLNGTLSCGTDTVNNASMNNYTITNFIFTLSHGNYTCNFTVSDGVSTDTTNDINIIVDLTIPTNPTIILPTEGYSFTAICDIPFKVTSNETTIDTWWYSLDNGTTNTTFTPNESLSCLADGNYTLYVWLNLTSGFNSTQVNVSFQVLYDGLYWEGTDNPATLLNNIEDVFNSMSAIAFAILTLSFFFVASRFEKEEETPLRMGFLAVGVLLAANTALIVIDDTVAGLPGFKLFVWIIRAGILFMGLWLVLKVMKFLSQDVATDIRTKY